MSEQVKRAVDSTLSGLTVQERHVSAIMHRVRYGDVRPARRMVSMRAALAMALAVLVLGVGATLALSGSMTRPGGVQPLSDNRTGVNGDVTRYLPGEDQISAEEAVSAAERYVHAHDDGSVDLRDSAVYRIDVTREILYGERPEDSVWLYTVTFEALNEFATAYTVQVNGHGQVTDFARQRGAGVGHTAQEIRIGYARVYGPDMTRWSAVQLSALRTMLKEADASSLRWTDLLMRQTVYQTMELASGGAWTEDEARLAAQQYLQSQGVTAQPDALVCMQDWPNSTVKVRLRETAAGMEWVHLVEMDALTRQVRSHVKLDARSGEDRVFYLQSAHEAQTQVENVALQPVLPDDEAIRAATDHVLKRWEGAYDVSSAAMYTVYVDDIDMDYNQCTTRVRFEAQDASQPSFWVLLDWYGQPMDAGISGVNGRNTLDDVRGNTKPGWEYSASELRAIQRAIVGLRLQDDPVAQLLCSYTYLDDGAGEYDFLIEMLQELGVYVYSDAGHMRIDAAPVPVCKYRINTDQGILLVETDSQTGAVLNVTQVASLGDAWYAPYMLQADMERAGLAPAAPVPTVNDGAVQESGAVMGMQVRHLLERYRQLYGADMLQWSQAQLQDFRQMVILSCDLGGDLGVYCLRNTVFPDVPAGGLQRAEAEEKARAALGREAHLDGAVLVGQQPVWKVRFTADDGCWYVEVDCFSGACSEPVRRLDRPAMTCPVYTDDTPDELWCRDIVPEAVIEECEDTWNRTSNG